MATDFSEFPSFRELNSTQIENFVAACRDRTMPSGTTLIEEGGRGESIYFVYEGELCIEIASATGARELAMIQAPAVLGEMEFLTGDPRTATVICKTDVRTLEIDFEALRARIQDGDAGTLKVFVSIASVLAHRLAAMDRKLSEIHEQEPERTADLVAFQRKLFGEWSV